MADTSGDAEIARLLAEDQGYYLERDYDYGLPADDSDSDPDYGSGKKKKGKKKGKRGSAGAKGGPGTPASAAGTVSPPPAASPPPAPGEVTASGRRKRKDTGTHREPARGWTEEEERLFQEAMALHGRDWKAAATHVKTRDHRAIASHAQKWLIKMLMRGEELPGRMGETGRGYTLSGKPLDPNSAAARAYGLKVDAFKKVVETGVLEVGVHVTTLEMEDGPARPREAKPPGEPKPKKAKKTAAVSSPAAAAPQAPAAAASPPAEPTEYARNRPRRQIPSTKAHLGETNESLDLTHLHEFVGPVGAGAPLSQPFSVTLAPEASLVMDFHAHLSTCEVIGLLGGRFDADARTVSIAAAFPCRRAAGSHSSTSVELDAESQVEVAAAMEARGISPVGWYHSHPVFEPRPSVKDNENQRNYQALCRDAETGLEPWVGAIVGPYDTALPSAASATQLWVVRPRGRTGLAAYNLKHTRGAPSDVPAAGGDVEAALAAALDSAKDDLGRVDPRDVWRAYTRLVQGTPDGPPLTIGQKIRLALSVHLPRDRPEELAAFFDRLAAAFREHWDVDLPELGTVENGGGVSNGDAAEANGGAAEGARVKEEAAEGAKAEAGGVNGAVEGEAAGDSSAAAETAAAAVLKTENGNAAAEEPPEKMVVEEAPVENGNAAAPEAGEPTAA